MQSLPKQPLCLLGKRLPPPNTIRIQERLLAQPNRTARLRDLDVPALVIHGLNDKMVHVSGGRATSQAIPGSELLVVPGMGHDLPVELYDTFVDAIRRVADRAR